MHSRVYRSKKVKRCRVFLVLPPPRSDSGCGILLYGGLPLEAPSGVPSGMTNLTANACVTVAGLVALGGLALWLVLRKRRTSEELERERRRFLVQSGRLVDGMLLDVCEVEAPAKSKSEPARNLILLVYNYRIGGVNYECSQDITGMPSVMDVSQVRAGFPCTARYQPGNPQNSIVVAEDWTGVRAGLPVLPAYEDPEPLDLSHLRPGRG